MTETARVEYLIHETDIAELVVQRFSDDDLPPIDLQRAQISFKHDPATGNVSIVVRAPIDVH